MKCILTFVFCLELRLETLIVNLASTFLKNMDMILCWMKMEAPAVVRLIRRDWIKFKCRQKWPRAVIKHKGRFQTNQTAVQYFGFVLTLYLDKEPFEGYAVVPPPEQHVLWPCHWLQALLQVDNTYSARVLCLLSTSRETLDFILVEAESKLGLKVQPS